MRFRTLIWRGLRFHWRSHLGVALGATVATAVLVGALALGDSVRYSLRRTALARTGEIKAAMVAPDRLFRDQLPADLEPLLHPQTYKPDRGSRYTVPVLQTRGTVTSDDGTVRINKAQVLGVDDRFWCLEPWRLLGRESTQSIDLRFWGADDGKTLLPDDEQHQVDINEATARRLNVRAGETILVRIEKTAALPLEMPLSGSEDVSLAVRATVRHIVADWEFGRFSLEANQVAPCNIYFPLKWLQELLGCKGQANVILAGDSLWENLAGDPDQALKEKWQLADAELELVPLTAGRGAVELRSKRVFLDPPVAQAAAGVDAGAIGILTYFVNELRVGERATPYSMVTAIGPLNPQSAIRNPQLPAPRPSPLGVLPAGMADDEIVINTWLAEDLAAKPGDTLDVTYYVLGPMRRLETRTSRFRIRAVVPMEGPAADRTLMPEFPGLAAAESARNWNPGIPIDLKRIRDKDEDYWKRYRGTPKAFVTLAAGQRMWANRFGDLTAVRFPGASADQVEKQLRARIDPKSLGLYFQEVRKQALAAAENATDFGGLFLGLSFFLAAAALVLTAMLFSLGIEQRAEETGTLLALGIPPARVRRLYLAEGACLAAVGGGVGSAAGLVYTQLVLVALATVWSGAVGAADLWFHADPATVAAGAAAGAVVAAAAIWLTVRRQARAPARELLAAGAEAELRPFLPARGRLWLSLGLALASGLGAVAILVLAPSGSGEQAAAAFFGAGTLVLVAGLAQAHAGLAMLARRAAGARLTLAGLGIRNATRRRGRSLGVIAVLACGVFMVVAVGANRRGSPADWEPRAGGTGGFALYGETTLPVLHDLNSAEGYKAYAIPQDLRGRFAVVPLRVREGDDASCLNLNRAQRPRLAGVRPEEMAGRGAFAFTETLSAAPGASPWLLLDRRADDGAVPAIADTNTITWALGKKVGDTLGYADDAGRTFQVRLVGALDGAILQGCLVISENAFIEKFPTASGYQMFLVDAPREQAAEVSKVLTAQMSDVGMAMTPTAERLAMFQTVENTYLAIFQALGGLGLVLGSIGLGVIVLRNVMERRGELGLLRAVGFRVRAIERLILLEHWLLLAAGLTVGTAAAIIAVLPALRSAGAAVPYGSLAAVLAAVLAGGLLWTYLAARLALRGPLLEALRNE
jgi:ABC-type antimicrobial peptide transport system permease subunit